jgi:hypothetical protein
VHVITARRAWRLGLEWVLFVSLLVLGVGLSLQPAAARTPSPCGGELSVLHMHRAIDAPVAHRWTTGGDRSVSPDASEDDNDDDDDDSDRDDRGAPAASVVSTEQQDQRAAGWHHTADPIDLLSSAVSDGNSLRAPPQ